jgi:hypothetical protein
VCSGWRIDLSRIQKAKARRRSLGAFARLGTGQREDDIPLAKQD